MKRKLFIVIAVLVLVGSFCLTACEEKKPDPAPESYTLSVINDDTIGTVHNVSHGMSVSANETLSFTIEPKDSSSWARASLNGNLLYPVDSVYTVTLKEDSTLDISYYNVATRGEDPVMQRRQQLVVDEMYKMVGTYFVYDQKYTYTLFGSPYTLKPGQLYRGMPYSSYANNTLDAFLTASVGKDGDAYIIGDLPERWELMLGNNCADCVYWSWSTVSDSFDYYYTRMMTEAHGCLKVGEYEYAVSNGFLVNTVADCTKNGLDVMAEAYAQLQPGDSGVYYVDDAGHAILITEVHVVRGENGKVDPANSWVRYHDQTGAYVLQTVRGSDQPDYLTCCNVNARLAFAEMFASGYLPISCAELLYGYEDVPPAAVTDSGAHDLRKETLLRGVIRCNYYMSHCTMEIINENGNTVQSATRYIHENTANKEFDLSRFGMTTREDSYGGDLYKTIIVPRKLPAGNYRCKVTAYIGNGETIIVRDFDFTV